MKLTDISCKVKFKKFFGVKRKIILNIKSVIPR